MATPWTTIELDTPFNFPNDVFRTLNLNELSFEWKTGAQSNSGGDALQELTGSNTGIDGFQVRYFRVFSLKSGRLSKTGQTFISPSGSSSSTTQIDYKDFNVPNNIQPPANVSSTSIAEATPALLDGLEPALGTDPELLTNRWVQAVKNIPTRLIVKYRAGLAPLSADAAGLPATLKFSATSLNSFSTSEPLVVELNGASLKQSVASLENDPRVEYVQPDYVRQASFTSFNDPNLKDQYYLNAVKMPRAWDTSSGSGVTIAVIDSGADTSNPDLANIKQTYNPRTNGAIDDEVGHGSWVSGIIGATANNSIYGSGIAYNSRLMVIQATNDQEQLLDSSIIAGLRFATDKGARVINMSLGGISERFPTALCNAVNYALSKNVVVVASSGNDGVDLPNYPSDCPGVISVGATGLLNQVTSFSSFGDNLTLVAPGIRVCGAVRAGKYGCANGTSASGPIVAAAAGLIIAVNPSLTNTQVKNILIAASVPINGKPAGQRDVRSGYGLINVATAVRMAATNQYAR